jgi:Putative peptidoglycan binding domain
MARRHVVQPGDCIASIAFESGLLPERVWEHADNRALRERRGDMHLLCVGDVVFVPDRAQRTVTVATGATHRFRRHAVPERLRLRFVDDEDRPRAGLRYELAVGERRSAGSTDSDGALLEWIPPDARSAMLTLHGTGGDEKYEVEIGSLGSASELDGVRARLCNLGYDCGDETGDQLGPLTTHGLRAFQADQDVAVTGTLDDATRAALLRAHGS